MPYTKRNFKRPNKKVYRKRKKYVKKGTQSTAVANVSYSSGTQLLADKYLGKLTWMKTYAIAAGTTDVVTFNTYNMVGLFDPESAVSPSHQPTNFDQLALFYQHYRVKGAKITVDFYHKTGNPMVVGLVETSVASAGFLTTKDEVMLDPSVTYKIIGADKPRARVVKYFSLKKKFDISKYDDLQATFAANPAEGYFNHVWSCNLGPGLTQASYDMVVKIDFIAEAFEPKKYAKS